MISIILPCHNSMPHLEIAIKSLFSSTRYPFELLLIESESTDGTKEFCDYLSKQFDNIKVFHTKKKGLTNAINYGIKKTKNSVYITQDDVIHFRLYGRDWLAEFAEEENDKSVGMLTMLGGYGISGEDYLKGLKWIGTWSCFIPRHTIEKVGLFDEKMGPGDDIDYSYRVKKAGLRLGFIDCWCQHHRLTEHFGDNEDLQRKMGEYFKHKHKV